MNYQFIDILDYGVLAAVVIGLVRFRKILRAYRPFVFIVAGALVSEFISSRVIAAGYSNAIPANCWSLAECLLYLWQFKRWDAFARKPPLYLVLVTAATTYWITEKIIFGKITTFQSGFAITYSFCLVFLAINQLNSLIIMERTILMRNAKFVICTGIILFFTYQIMVDSFYVFRLDNSEEFMGKVFKILVIVNLIVNILFGYAATLLPIREPFRFRY
ncbi:MAG: hypothetical protein ABI415_08765 [Flavitalea sp.]